MRRLKRSSGLGTTRRLCSLSTTTTPFFPIVIENLLTATPNTVLEGNLSLLSFGWRVASGDLNGDGFADVVAAAPGWDGGQADEGAVLVFHGGPTGIASNGSGSIAAAADAIVESDVADMGWPSSGSAVIGDLNGDGYDDFAVGHPRWDPITRLRRVRGGVPFGCSKGQHRGSPLRGWPMPTVLSGLIFKGHCLELRCARPEMSTATDTLT